MRYVLTFVVLFLFVFSLEAQVKKEVDNGVFVTFPSDPTYNPAYPASVYMTATENCVLMAMIQRNAIPSDMYSEYIKAKQHMSNAEIEKIESGFLDNAVKGMVDLQGNTGVVKPIKVGKYSGREVFSSMINPATGNRTKTFFKSFLIRDKMLTFYVLYQKDNKEAEREREMFLNSIVIN